MLNELIGAVVQVLFFSLLPLAVWYAAARKKETFFSWIGLKKPVCKNKAVTILSAIVMTLLYIGAMSASVKTLPDGVTTAGSQFAGGGLKALPAAFFYAFLRTALSEEILFRGFALKLVQKKAGFAAGNTVQALLFGLMHGIPFGLVTKSILAFGLLTLLPGLFGWYEGWMNEKQCDGSIMPSWLLHGTVNFVTAAVSLF
jgi:membrane protease YdiL (CAAX protease family)